MYQVLWSILAHMRQEQVRSWNAIKLFCIGYSGEDVPRSVIPSCLGVLEGEHAKLPQKPPRKVEEDAEMDGAEEAKEHPSIRLISGKSEIAFKRDHMKIEPLYSQEGQSK